MILKDIYKSVCASLVAIGLEPDKAVLEYPADLAHGDISTNVAMTYAKVAGIPPRELAETLRLALMKELAKNEIGISKIEVVGPGFINFFFSEQYIFQSLKQIVITEKDYGKNQSLAGEKIIVEYTDPNPFKEFHIGHLMSNTVGESVARLYEYTGAEVKRACYQGDVGLHVANAVWGMIKEKTKLESVKSKSLSEKMSFLGECYVSGAKQVDDKVRSDIRTINNSIFKKDDETINSLYDLGRAWSLEYFEYIYKRLGTHFDFYFFENKTGPIGKKLVEEFLTKGIFEKSDGAVIYRGEKHGLHTRVFLNKDGLPTYEAKELGLAKLKYDIYPYNHSIVITGNEINEYFKVLLSAMRDVYPEYADKTTHLSHGMMRLPSGKMSSRTGEVITAETLLSAVEAMVHDKLDDRELMDMEKNKIAAEVALGAVKFSILRQAIGGNIIFNFDESISFEGDSGPYLQYSYARAMSVIRKAEEMVEKAPPPRAAGYLERLLIRFPHIVSRAQKEHAPHSIVSYLLELSGAFNNFYAHSKILDAGEDTPYRLMLTKAFAMTMKNGLYLLGITTVEKM